MKTGSVWQEKLGDTPDWTDFGLKVIDMSEVMDYRDTAADWKNINSTERTWHFQGESLEKWPASSKPGYMLTYCFMSPRPQTMNGISTITGG